MFRPNTLFVLGAGASCEAKMPSGHALKEIIQKALDFKFDYSQVPDQGDERIAQYMLERVQGRPDRNAFNAIVAKARAIRDGMPLALSIDNYLDAHRGDDDIEFIGKLAIVAAIVEAEDRSLLRARGLHREHPFPISDLAETWYVRFAQLLTENVPKDDVAAAIDKVSVINFNYDRTLEHFLIRAIMKYYQIAESPAAQLANRLKVHRPYGGLGPLPWQAQGGLPFGEYKFARLDELGQRIRTFGERIEEGEALDELRAMVAGAETIVFLGFGFHRQNIRLITPTAGPGPTARVYASRLGISASNWAEIHEALASAFARPGGEAKLAGRPTIFQYRGSCADLLDEYRWSLTE